MDVNPLIELCKEKNFAYNVRGYNPELILVGERHGLSCLDDEEKIIETIRPKVVLHEAADPMLASNSQSKVVFSWQEKFDVQVKLCDIPTYDADSRQDKQFLEHHSLNMMSRFGFDSNYNLYLSMSTPIREACMSKIILDELGNKNTPVLAVVGEGHIMPYSKIHSFLGATNFDYITISQSPDTLQAIDQFNEFFTRT